MAKINPLKGKPSLRLNTNHVSWNYEASPDMPHEAWAQAVRYHFVINRKTRENCQHTLGMILDQIANAGGSFTGVRGGSARSGRWNMHHFFVSYDSDMAPRIIAWSQLDIEMNRVVRDRRLVEGAGPTGDIADYVAELYHAS